MTDAAKTHAFQAEVSQVLRLVINSLYSNKDIFLRELISNASDALDKLRFRAVTESDLVGGEEELSIRLSADSDAGTLTITDNGVGMTEEELVRNLGTIAHSGSREFLEKLQKGEKDLSLIGEFGVGFYSAYLVADKVEVITRGAGQDQANRWISEAKDSFTVEPAEREDRGTDIVLHLREDLRDYLNEWKLRNLINRYSDFVNHPVQLLVTKTEGEGDDKVETKSFETINKASALWQRPAEEITDEQYEEFYKYLTADFEGPLARTHFRIEGTQLFTGLLFAPKRAPMDLYDRTQRHGVRLYVKRVFIMDDCEEVLPRWLRFMRGVIDSDDLPLNVSREILQDSSLTRTIRKQIIKKTLDLFEDMAENQPEDYKELWDLYGLVLKEGIPEEFRHRDRITELLRFDSSRNEGFTSLKDYKERMPEGQKDILYAMGRSRGLLESSPHMEAVRKKGYEVLYFTDPIDQLLVDHIREYEDLKLVSVMKEDLDLGDDESEEEKEARNERAEGLKPLTDRFQNVLDEHIKTVRVSERLTESPVCLVIPDGGLPSHIEMLLRAQHQDMPKTQRIMEVNPTHPLIQNLQQIFSAKPESNDVNDWISLLYDQALLAEGSPIHDPAAFAGRMTRLMQTATDTALSEA